MPEVIVVSWITCPLSSAYFFVILTKARGTASGVQGRDDTGNAKKIYFAWGCFSKLGWAPISPRGRKTTAATGRGVEFIDENFGGPRGRLRIHWRPFHHPGDTSGRRLQSHHPFGRIPRS